MKLQTIFSCALSLSLSASSYANTPPEVKLATLTNSEIQEILGIQAWKISIPEGYTSIGVLYEIDGEIKQSGAPTGSMSINSTDRTALITIKSQDSMPDNYHVQLVCATRLWRKATRLYSCSKI